MNLIVFKHHKSEGAGRISQWANDRNVVLHPCFAPDWFTHKRQFNSRFDGIIILGGPMNVDDNPLWMRHEQSYIQQALVLQKPILAICLGAQLVAKALGAEIYELPEAEMNWQIIQFSDKRAMSVPQWHEQGFQFSLSAIENHSLTIEAHSPACPQQLYRGKNVLGVQFHPEWHEEQLVLLREAFKTDCPFIKSENIRQQQVLQQWFFSELDWLFKSR
ncbi:type 1 glutamine amidotransferase [Shewanella gaetbuli]